MAQATLISHTPSGQVVTLDELRQIPAGPSLGSRHRPVAHGVLVDAVRDSFAARGYGIAREQYAVAKEGARLFGAIDLLPQTGRALFDPSQGQGMAVGIRHSNDQAFALGLIAGVRVFVCDNLAFSGGESLLHRKHTSGLRLDTEIRLGMERAFGDFEKLAQLMAMSQEREVSTDDAELLMYKLSLEGQVIAPNQLGKVHQWYFEPERIAQDNTAAGIHLDDPQRGFDDVTTRTVYSVMNAVTRVARDFPVWRQQETGALLTDFVAGYLTAGNRN